MSDTPVTAPVPPDANAWPKGRLVAHPQPGKVWVQVPHRNDIGSDWIEADELVPADANGLRERMQRVLDDELANLADDGARLSHAAVRRMEAVLAASEAAPAAGDLADRLRVAREQRGLSYREAAEQIGCPTSTVHKIEHGGDPRWSTVQRVLAWLQGGSR